MSTQQKKVPDNLSDLNNDLFQDPLLYKGGIDCSANPNYPAADAGFFYKITVAGKIGGASGRSVIVNDKIYCNTDGSASGTQAAVGANWDIISGESDIATAINAATDKATPVDADLFGIVDSAASNVLKKLSWANIKATLKTYTDTLYAAVSHSHAAGDITSGTKTSAFISDFNAAALAAAPAETATTVAVITNAATNKATPIDADKFPLNDSAASNALKHTLWSDIKTTLKAYFDTLYAAAGSSGFTSQVKAYLGSNQIISTGYASRATLVLDTESYDTGGEFNTTTNTFTAGSTGYYQVCATLNWSSWAANTGFEFYMVIATVEKLMYNLEMNNGTGAWTFNYSQVIKLNATNTLSFKAAQYTGSNKTLTGGDYSSWVTITRVG